MTKLQIFIDFEAITPPFSRELKLNTDFPYAYTIGIKKGNKHKTMTTIINFSNVGEDSVYEYIRKDIVTNAKKLIANTKMRIGKSNTYFTAWAPNLEKKILAKSFEGFEVKDLTKGDSLSLSQLTKEDFAHKEYFPTLRSDIVKQLDEDFIKRRGLNLDGAIAALTGHILYSDSRNLEGKYYVKTNIRSLLKELVQYSKDDVLRMMFLADHPSLFTKRKKALMEHHKEKEQISRKINRLKSIQKNIKDYDKTKTVEELFTDLTQEISLLESKKDKMKL